MKRKYVSRQFGPGYCRKGHRQEVHGLDRNGRCLTCAKRNALASRERARARKYAMRDRVGMVLGW